MAAGAVTVASDGNSLTFDTPAHVAGLVDVTVTTPGGTTSPALGFTYVPPAVAPTATGIVPTEGPIAGGTSVTITGTGFVAGQTTVDIGGNTVAAVDVTVAPGGLTLTFDTPAHVAGLVDVTVTTPGGTTSPALGFTYVPPAVAAPTATGIVPNAGSDGRWDVGDDHWYGVRGGADDGGHRWEHGGGG